jgi:uncharacterized RDD family membrane protein YckC/type II secretory pathway pseudopilin PulG
MDNQVPPPPAPLSPSAASAAAAPDRSAGFWLRAGAYMIDGILIAIVGGVFFLILPPAVSVVARIVISAAYFTLMTVNARGQTVGKMAAGVAVVRDDGSPITYGRAFARWLGYLASGLTLCLGFVCAAFTDRKRALHDYIAGTRVVRVQEIGSGRKLAVVLVGLFFPLIVVLGIGAALAIPRLPGLKGLADEGMAKAHLGMVRSALASYNADTKGSYPPDLNSLVPKYIPQISAPGVAAHPGAAGVEVYGAEVCTGSTETARSLDPAKLRDTGKWGYVVAPGAPCAGAVFVDCTHTDSKGGPWYAY